MKNADFPGQILGSAPILPNILGCMILILLNVPTQVRGHILEVGGPEDRSVVILRNSWPMHGYEVQILQNHARSGKTIDPSTGQPIFDLLMTERLQILRNGALLDQVEDEKIDLRPWPDKKYTPPGVGANVIGTATPNVIAYAYSGGAHCCFTVHIYELGEPFRKVDTIHGEDYEPRFRQLDGDQALEIEMIEPIFQYWRAGPSDAVRPRVILKYDSGKKRYVFSPALMRRPPPAATELQGQADAVRALPLWTEHRRPPPKLWEVLLDLIYAGNYPLARPFLDRAWNDAAPDKEEFWDELIKCQMRHGRFWPDIAALNGLPPAKPEGTCPGPQ